VTPEHSRPSVGKAIAAVLLASLCAAAPALWAASFLGVEVPPPLPAKNVVDTYWNTPVDDPYRFLENTKDPVVQAWMKAQADATEAILAKLPARAALLARIEEIDKAAPAAVISVQRTASGRLFYLRRNASDNQFKLVYRDTVDGPDVVLVDPETLAKATGKPHAIGGFTPSPDGQRVVYAVSAGGSEIGTQHVLDVASGKEVDRPVPAVRGDGAVSWLPDSKGYFYFRLKLNWASLPASERFQDSLRYLRILGAEGEDRAVFGPGVHADVSVPRSAYGYVFAIEGTRLAASVVRDGVKREQSLYLADMADVLSGKARWRKVFGEEALVTETTIAGGWVYVKTAAQAPRYKVLRMPLARADLSKAEVVLPAGDDVIMEIGAARDALYVTQRQGPLTRLLRYVHGDGASLQPVDLPTQGHVDLIFTDSQQDGAVFRLSAWTRATTLHAAQPARPATGGVPSVAVKPLPLIPTGRFDAPEGLIASPEPTSSSTAATPPCCTATAPMAAPIRPAGARVCWPGWKGAVSSWWPMSVVAACSVTPGTAPARRRPSPTPGKMPSRLPSGSSRSVIRRRTGSRSWAAARAPSWWAAPSHRGLTSSRRQWCRWVTPTSCARRHVPMASPTSTSTAPSRKKTSSAPCSR
jgi:prolyl oligopeptidase